MKYHLLVETDVQKAYANYLRQRRQQAKLSRKDLSLRSSVPASTIKKFELTGQISFRQLLLLWQTLDDLKRLIALTKDLQQNAPDTIDEVLKDGF